MARVAGRRACQANRQGLPARLGRTYIAIQRDNGGHVDQGGVVERLLGKLNSLIGKHDGATGRSINHHNSNRVFETYDAIIDAACDTWRKLIAEPKTITSIGMRDWAHIGQHCSLWYKPNPRAPVSAQARRLRPTPFHAPPRSKKRAAQSASGSIA
ncbi:hypothetical protein [Methylocystis rosea]|uniref:Transposase n=1 Tax=Methylocystis rosea TaxID=173366 RepID=A0A3G8MCC3_9HYPH|nr:hypothetical protein EHO51_19085 [Methylocystis rosea]